MLDLSPISSNPMACIVQSDCVVATAFFIAGAALKLKTFLATMTISLPVLGLRPLREFFLRTAKMPKFFIFTFSPRSKEALIISKRGLHGIDAVAT